MSFFFFLVQNGSLHQKETVHDNDFEPYLTGQSNPVRNICLFFLGWENENENEKNILF